MATAAPALLACGHTPAGPTLLTGTRAECSSASNSPILSAHSSMLPRQLLRGRAWQAPLGVVVDDPILSLASKGQSPGFKGVRFPYPAAEAVVRARQPHSSRAGSKHQGAGAGCRSANRRYRHPWWLRSEPAPPGRPVPQ